MKVSLGALEVVGLDEIRPSSQPKSDDGLRTSAPNKPSASSASPANPIGPTPKTNPPGAPGQVVVSNSEVTLEFWLEGVRRFFDEGQKRRTSEFTLSNGVANLKFFFKFSVNRSCQNSREYLSIKARVCKIAKCEAKVLVRVDLLSQISYRRNKQRRTHFKFNATKKENGYPFFITHDDLKQSNFLKKDRLHLQLTCRLVSVKPLPEPKPTQKSSASLGSA